MTLKIRLSASTEQKEKEGIFYGDKGPPDGSIFFIFLPIEVSLVLLFWILNGRLGRREGEACRSYWSYNI